MQTYSFSEFVDGQKQLATRLYGPNGQVISEVNPLEVRVRHLESILGTAVASPTQYTLAARLKEIKDSLDALEKTAGIKKITDAVNISDREERKLGEVTFPSPQEVTLTGHLPSGTNTIGKVQLVDRGPLDASALINLMTQTADGTAISSVAKHPDSIVPLLKSPYGKAVIWDRELPTKAFFDTATNEFVVGGTAITGEVRYFRERWSLYFDIGSSAASDAHIRRSYPIDWTDVSLLNIDTIYTSNSHSRRIMEILIGDTIVFSSITHHDQWVSRSFDVSEFTGVLPLRLSARVSGDITFSSVGFTEIILS